MRRSALIVDDSRVATVTLKRMLEPHHIAVETAESGEEALEYLRSNMPPSAVFLDHMMPGMDGFEVLGLLKKDARLASVPVVMYTSKEGEAYMGQALARGALAVLSKPPSPVALLRILEQLRLVNDPAVTVPVAAQPGAKAPAVARAANPVRLVTPRTTPAAAPPRAAAANVVPPVASAPATAPSTVPVPEIESVPEATPVPTPRWSLFWIALYTLLLLAPTLWLWQQYRVAERARTTLAQENRALQERALGAAAVPAVAAESPGSTRWADALAWAVNLHNRYGYDELPLDDQRLALVRELVARTTQAGFKGTVRVETHVGEFCLARDGFGGFKLPEPTTPIADCEIIDYTAEQATTLGRRQSPAFSRYLVTQSNTRAPVQVEVVSHGNERPLVPYPNVGTLRTAGEWNSIASRNHRVQIALVPSAE